MRRHISAFSGDIGWPPHRLPRYDSLYTISALNDGCFGGGYPQQSCKRDNVATANLNCTIRNMLHGCMCDALHPQVGHMDAHRPGNVGGGKGARGRRGSEEEQGVRREQPRLLQANGGRHEDPLRGQASDHKAEDVSSAPSNAVQVAVTYLSPPASQPCPQTFVVLLPAHKGVFKGYKL